MDTYNRYEKALDESMVGVVVVYAWTARPSSLVATRNPRWLVAAIHDGFGLLVHVAGKSVRLRSTPSLVNAILVTLQHYFISHGK